jgi:hypothetical protein
MKTLQENVGATMGFFTSFRATPAMVGLKRVRQGYYVFFPPHARTILNTVIGLRPIL